MSPSEPIRAPLQLEKLTNEELLRDYCETREESYVLALWERLADRNDKKSLYWELWKARHICPLGYDPKLIFFGSFSRTYFKFKTYICNYRGRLDSPVFPAFKRWIVSTCVIEEYWFIKGRGHAIWVQITDFHVLDDSGKLIRTEREENAELWKELARARQQDQERLAAEEGIDPEGRLGDVGGAHAAEGDVHADDETAEETAPDDTINAVLNELPRGDYKAPPPPTIGRIRYRSRRLYRTFAQLPRPDAALSAKERRHIVKLLLLYHLTTMANADCMDEIIRFFYRALTVAAIARWKYGDPANETVRDRHEKRVRDTLQHDLKSMRNILKTKLKITAFSQV